MWSSSPFCGAPVRPMEPESALRGPQCSICKTLLGPCGAPVRPVEPQSVPWGPSPSGGSHYVLFLKHCWGPVDQWSPSPPCGAPVRPTEPQSAQWCTQCSIVKTLLGPCGAPVRRAGPQSVPWSPSPSGGAHNVPLFKTLLAPSGPVELQSALRSPRPSGNDGAPAQSCPAEPQPNHA